MAGIGLTPCRAMAAEDIRNLQSRARHARASAGRPDLLELERDVLQRAHDLADRLGGDAGIERRGVELGVTEQHLDHANVDVLLQQMGGEAVPQGVQGDALADPGHLGGGMAGAIELARRHRIDRVQAGKQPPLWPGRLVPGAQQLEQMRRQHHVAIAFLAELGDLSRFENPRQLLAYLGLTPSERSTGESVKRGGITKAGNTRARRLLIEAAWSYRFPPRVSKDMQTRIGAAPRTAREIAWKAQMRLCGRFRTLTRKGKRPTIVVTAIARELSAFIWAINREVVGSHATANQ